MGLVLSDIGRGGRGAEVHPVGTHKRKKTTTDLDIDGEEYQMNLKNVVDLMNYWVQRYLLTS